MRRLPRGFRRISPCRTPRGSSVRGARFRWPGPSRPREGAGCGRYRGRGGVHGPGCEPGRHRGAETRRQRDRCRRGHGQHAGRDHPLRGRPWWRRIHGDLPGQDTPGRDHRRPRDMPQRLHADDVHRPEDRPAARLRLCIGSAAGYRRPRHGGHLGQSDQLVRPRQPGRGPPAGDRAGGARIPRQRGFPAAHRVRPARAAGLPGQPRPAADPGRQPAARGLPAPQS